MIQGVEVNDIHAHDGEILVLFEIGMLVAGKSSDRALRVQQAGQRIRQTAVRFRGVDAAVTEVADETDHSAIAPDREFARFNPVILTADDAGAFNVVYRMSFQYIFFVAHERNRVHMPAHVFIRHAENILVGKKTVEVEEIPVGTQEPSVFILPEDAAGNEVNQGLKQFLFPDDHGGAGHFGLLLGTGIIIQSEEAAAVRDKRKNHVSSIEHDNGLNQCLPAVFSGRLLQPEHGHMEGSLHGSKTLRQSFHIVQFQKAGHIIRVDVGCADIFQCLLQRQAVIGAAHVSASFEYIEEYVIVIIKNVNPLKQGIDGTQNLVLDSSRYIA